MATLHICRCKGCRRIDSFIHMLGKGRKGFRETVKCIFQSLSLLSKFRKCQLQPCFHCQLADDCIRALWGCRGSTLGSCSSPVPPEVSSTIVHRIGNVFRQGVRERVFLFKGGLWVLFFLWQVHCFRAYSILVVSWNLSLQISPYHLAKSPQQGRAGSTEPLWLSQICQVHPNSPCLPAAPSSTQYLQAAPDSSRQHTAAPCCTSSVILQGWAEHGLLPGTKLCRTEKCSGPKTCPAGTAALLWQQGLIPFTSTDIPSTNGWREPLASSI